MSDANYTLVDKEQHFILNFMYDLSHMMEDKGMSPEKRLERYSDYAHLKGLQKESIVDDIMLVATLKDISLGSCIANTTVQDDHFCADHDEELDTNATRKERNANKSELHINTKD